MISRDIQHAGTNALESPQGLLRRLWLSRIDTIVTNLVIGMVFCATLFAVLQRFPLGNSEKPSDLSGFLAHPGLQVVSALLLSGAAEFVVSRLKRR